MKKKQKINNDDNNLIGALDQGTSSTRFMIFDRYGNVCASHQVELSLIYPHGDGESWVEQNPIEILETVEKCMKNVFISNKNMIQRIKCIGITNQRETTVVWDRNTGKPLYNAIVWLDQRSTNICELLTTKYGSKDIFRKICGLPLSSYFSATKLKWLIDNVPKVKLACDNGTCMFGTVDSWLIWNLSGGINGGKHITDITNASRTMLMDLNTCQWSKEMCETFNIPMNILPQEICSNSQIFAYINNESNPLNGLPISGCLGDQQAAMVGQLCYTTGDVKNTYGTGCFMLINSGTKIIQSTKGLLTTVCYQLGNKESVHYALEGSVAVAGVAIKWMRDNLKLFESAEEVSNLASTVSSANGMYFVPAFSGLFAPYWRSDARGVICGLTFEHNRAHFARSIIEAVCYRSTDVISLMEEESKCKISSLRVDGGMTASKVLLQFQADILNIDVLKPSCLETTALGAAIAAGLACNIWNDLKDVQETIGSKFTITKSQMNNDLRQISLNGWKKAIEKAF